MSILFCVVRRLFAFACLSALCLGLVMLIDLEARRSLPQAEVSLRSVFKSSIWKSGPSPLDI